MLHGHHEKGMTCAQGGWALCQVVRVTRVLHEVRERAGWMPCNCVVGRSGVNQADEELGQPRQVMTAGTYGPSGQPIFDIVTSDTPCTVDEAALLRSSSELAPWLHVAVWVR